MFILHDFFNNSPFFPPQSHNLSQILHLFYVNIEQKKQFLYIPF